MTFHIQQKPSEINKSIKEKDLVKVKRKRIVADYSKKTIRRNTRNLLLF